VLVFQKIFFSKANNNMCHPNAQRLIEDMAGTTQFTHAVNFEVDSREIDWDLLESHYMLREGLFDYHYDDYSRELTIVISTRSVWDIKTIGAYIWGKFGISPTRGAMIQCLRVQPSKIVSYLGRRNFAFTLAEIYSVGGSLLNYMPIFA
jgi:hypothetical protein